MAAGRIVGLWRYPVKSFAGERCDELALEGRGVAGDRRWALVDRDGKIASGKTTRRFRRVDGLLRHGASLDEAGRPLLQLADGRRLAATTELAAELAGHGWRFALEGAVPHFDAGAVHLVTTASLEGLGAAEGAAVEAERLRPNLLVDAGRTRDEAWIGRRLRVGEAELEVTDPTERCVMVGHAQRGLPRRTGLLRTIVAWNDLCVGVYARVVRTGRIRVGDALYVD